MDAGRRSAVGVQADGDARDLLVRALCGAGARHEGGAHLRLHVR